MTGQKFIAFFFIPHLPFKVKGVTVGSEFERQRRGHHCQAVITSSDLMSLLHLKERILEVSGECPLVVASLSACCAMQTIRPESSRWCRIMWLVIQWLGVVWVCVTLSKHPAHHRVVLCSYRSQAFLRSRKVRCCFAHLTEVEGNGV